MHERINKRNKKRLKRCSFTHQTILLEKEDAELERQEPIPIPVTLEKPVWRGHHKPTIRCTIPGILYKEDQSGPVMKALTLEYIQEHFPRDTWTRVYTDGAADKAVRNGGAGVYIQYPEGEEEQISTPTGHFSSNYNAEVMALLQGAKRVLESPHTASKVVFLSDAKSVLQAVHANKDKELDYLFGTLYTLTETHETVLQWIPAHCGIVGNETADKLAKEGSKKDQQSREAKHIIKQYQQRKWADQHSTYNKCDPYYELDRSEQVLIFRLRTGHNRMNHHMYTKFKIGSTDQCPCAAGAMTAEHLLQTCPLYKVLRKRFWSQPTSLQNKLFGCLDDLRRTATFARETQATI